MVDILTVFLHLVITPYFFLLDLLYPVTYGNTDPSFLFLQLAWIVAHVLKLFLIIQPCSATCNEARRTGTLVAQLLNNCHDSSIKKQLETFALQLIHQRVEFSACGFYTLNFPLIASIAGSVTTYLVILIQFQASDS
ncbi:gustatory receptor for sugar taste 43a-like [Anabrus simplex]|uniref:gustatory receptor for sugar taste 43a-like n=1 Tax=Anabrus simplex TaxID=316456 RepID=UPI0034DD6F9C